VFVAEEFGEEYKNVTSTFSGENRDFRQKLSHIAQGLKLTVVGKILSRQLTSMG